MGRVRVKGGVEAVKGLSRGQGRPGGGGRFRWKTTTELSLNPHSLGGRGQLYSALHTGIPDIPDNIKYTRYTRTIIPDKMHSIHILIDS